MMAAFVDEKVPAELIEKWVNYLRPGDIPSFRQVCASATLENMETAIRPFFFILETSLMGLDLEKLRSISQDSHVRHLVKNIIIHDQCEELDPWTASPLPIIGASYDIWPSDDRGFVVTNEIGITVLTHVLRMRLLCPTMIKIRSYRIALQNFRLGPELNYLRDLIQARSPSGIDTGTVAGMAKDLVEGANVAITSLAIQHADREIVDPPAELEQIFKPWLMCNPEITEATIGLCDEYEGPETDLSMLCWCVLTSTEGEMSYWVQRVFYEAKALRTLDLRAPGIETSQMPSLEAERTALKLFELDLSFTVISATQLFAMIASSRKSLQCFNFRHITLTNGSSWREVLVWIAKECRALTSFYLKCLRSTTGTGREGDMHRFRRYLAPEDRVGQSIQDIDPGRRTNRVNYAGRNAPAVLEFVAKHGYVPTEEEIIQRKKSDRLEWEAAGTATSQG